jgi:Fur family ferric uptake transcriptional regulator
MTTPLTRSQTIPRLPRSVGISPSAQLEGLPPTASHQEQLLPKRSALDEASLRKIIRDMGLKVTDQRLLILKALHTGRAHVTAQEVFETVSNKDSSIGFATVYRFLRSLTESGFVTEVRLGGSSARYELKPEGHHDHLTCVKCGKICEFENSQIENLQARVAEQFGFQLTGHVLELYGVCYDCQ